MSALEDMSGRTEDQYYEAVKMTNWLFQVVKTRFNQEKRRKFIKFWFGTETAPMGGFANLKPAPVLDIGRDEHRLYETLQDYRDAMRREEQQQMLTDGVVLEQVVDTSGSSGNGGNVGSSVVMSIGQPPSGSREVLRSSSDGRGLERQYVSNFTADGIPLVSVPIQQQSQYPNPVTEPRELSPEPVAPESQSQQLTLNRKRPRSEIDPDTDDNGSSGSGSEGSTTASAGSRSQPPPPKRRRRRRMKLPYAAVCLNILNIPLYDKIEDMQADLELVIENVDAGVTKN